MGDVPNFREGFDSANYDFASPAAFVLILVLMRNVELLARNASDPLL